MTRRPSASRLPRLPRRGRANKNGSERLLRLSVNRRKMINGYRAMWATEGEAATCTGL